MQYFIKKLPEHDLNPYRYSYLDHLETIIDLRDNYWDFDMQLYVIDNACVPLNTYTIDLQIPYQTASNIVFNLATDQSGVKQRVDGNRDYAKLLESQFIVDVSQNEYLKQNLENAKVNCIVSLQIDPEPIEKASFSPDQECLNGFINEAAEQRTHFDLDYSNYYQVEKGKELMNNYGFTLDWHQTTCFAKARVVDIACEDYLENTKSINKLTSIASQQPFQVLAAKVKFHYWLDLEQEEKLFEVNLEVDTKQTYKTEICLNQATSYDFINDKVILNPAGIMGFYIPKYSSGYYELELKFCQDGNIHTFLIKNEFNFLQNINNPYIALSNVTINDLKDYKEVIW